MEQNSMNNKSTNIFLKTHDTNQFDTTIKTSKINNDAILIDLIKNQRKIISADKKLLYNDLKRISKYLSTTIFSDKCSLWSGYVTTVKNEDKSSYINFYFNGRKYALHRLLYLNYIGELADSEYIKFKCPNKGKCCNINHFYKNDKIDIKPDIISDTKTEPIESIPVKQIIKNIVVDFKF
jgi:hypothetical protein